MYRPKEYGLSDREIEREREGERSLVTLNDNIKMRCAGMMSPLGECFRLKVLISKSGKYMHHHHPYLHGKDGGKSTSLPDCYCLDGELVLIFSPRKIICIERLLT